MQVTKRVTIPLTEAECEALRTMAIAELRDPREQARFLLRRALGLTECAPNPNEKSATASQAQGALQPTI